MKKFALSILLLLIFTIPGASQPERTKIVEGNELYEEERYDEALNKYIDAQTQAPESKVINFNIGNAQYKKNKYEEALKEFETTLTADDAGMQAQSYYNMGNTMYRMGKLPESILMFKKSLELNPDDEDAKYNLEFVRKQLKDQSDKQNQDQQQQQQQQQDQQQQNQNNENQDKQDQQQQDQQQQDQQQQQPQQEQEQQQDQQQNENEDKNQQDKQQQQQQQQSAEEMSKEDAEKILSALKENEDDIKDARKIKAPAGIRVTKDW